MRDKSGQPAPALRSQFAGDPEMAELIEMFVSELPQRLEAMLSAFRQGEIETVQRVAHQLRGSSTGYGYPAIGAAAGRLEDHLRGAADPAKALTAVRAGIDELSDLCRRAMMGVK